MGKLQSENFQQELGDVLSEIEQQTHAEIVALISPESGKYKEASWIWGVIFAFIAFTFMMFSPWIFGDYLIYFVPIFAFAIGVLVSELFDPVRKLFISRADMRSTVEIKARAAFQKGKLFETQNRIAVLFYFSVFERHLCILPDTGAKSMIPAGKWNVMQLDFKNALKSNHSEKQIVHVFRQWKHAFSEYIPKTENDVNELPESLKIEL